MPPNFPPLPLGVGTLTCFISFLPIDDEGSEHYRLSFAHPEWMPSADHLDPKQAVAMGRRLLDKPLTDRQWDIGFHQPFPGIGFIERSRRSYRFV